MSGFAEPWLLYGLFFLSGAAALIYQVQFGKRLMYVFGSMSTATNTVLATYMGGMALGAWLGGAVAPRLRRPVIAYAACEAGIAVYCAASPLIFALVQNVYVAMAIGQAPESPFLLPLRVLLGAAALVIPTALMGVTLPVLAQFFEHSGQALGRTVGRLYAANTLGAGLGALVAGYLLLPLIGLRATTLVAVAANLIVALLALRFTNGQPRGLAADIEPASERQQHGSVAHGRIAILILACGGFVTLALEVDFIHLLAVVAGNSTYAFSLMLFAFLIGLGLGAETARRMLRRMQPMRLLAWLECALCVTLVLAVAQINAIPGFFAGFGERSIELGWAARELIRGLVCCSAMLPPAFFIGAIFPVAVESIGRAFPERRIRMLGFAAALNTLGNILGVLVAGFVMLPALGPMLSIRLLAALCVLLGLTAAVCSPTEHRARVIASIAASAFCVALFFPVLDYDRVTTGANVYFRPEWHGHVIDRAESLDGGLTSVNELQLDNGERLLTLLTNGKFQGVNGSSGEAIAQEGFALAPLLHNAQRTSALVIGYGTGTTSRVLHDAGFARLEIVDLSADIFRLANRHLADVNGRVTEKPGVYPHVTDGRNFLLLAKGRYDVISMEINSIWFAGAASLYSRDFYRLARAHLNDGGVLQQWMQLHHAAPLDVFYVLGSLRAEFRYVWLYVLGGQGIIVATDSGEARPTAEHAGVIDAAPALRMVIERHGGSAAHVSDGLLLDPDGVDRFLASRGVPASYFVSDDDNAHLEYSTPKGNALDGAQSAAFNFALLARFKSQAPRTN